MASGGFSHVEVASGEFTEGDVGFVWIVVWWLVGVVVHYLNCSRLLK